MAVDPDRSQKNFRLLNTVSAHLLEITEYRRNTISKNESNTLAFEWLVEEKHREMKAQGLFDK